VVKIDTAMGVLEFQTSMVKEVKLGDGGPAAPPAKSPAGPAAVATPGETPQAKPDAAALPPSVGKVDPAVLAKYTEALKAVEKAVTGAEGLAILDAFLKDCPTGPLAEQVRARMTLWKERADKNLVKFGPTQWLPKEQVDARRTKAEELLGKAEADAKTDDAAKLYDQASEQDPFRADIPMKLATRYYKDKNQAKYGMALGKVVKIDPNNVCARNNMGVIQATQKQWAAAMANIAKAATLVDNDKILDNLDQVAAMAAEDTGSTGQSGADSQAIIQAVVAHIHNEKKHVGENRWGNAWVKEADYQKNLKDNAEIDRKIAADRAAFVTLKAQYVQADAERAKIEKDRRTALAYVPLNYGTTVGGTTYFGNDPYYIGNLEKKKFEAIKLMTQCEKDGKAAVDDAKNVETKRVIPPHAGKLVLLDPDGKAELETVAPPAAPKPAEGGKPVPAPGGRLFNG